MYVEKKVLWKIFKFKGSGVCLGRYDSYGNFGFKKLHILILREFSKRTHCPPIVILALLLFLMGVLLILNIWIYKDYIRMVLKNGIGPPWNKNINF